ncbi:hypothetical protein A4A49_05526 [Nicotiana attenuata]|uniref:Uncharacterized protein n=1 Tax=Nicotiana attenuata TaxID=49451 RepID=A0A314L258_NICAT|nr:hypothetical protein A4A49_05526 [Nicotiana attenuata]
MNTGHQKIWATLAVFLVATDSGYGAWLICTAVSILLAELVLVLLRRCYISYYRVNPIRARRHCNILGPLVALCVAPLFSHLHHKQIHVYVILLVAAMAYFYFYVLQMSRPGPKDFWVLNVLCLRTVNLAYGMAGFGPATCLWVISFTYMAIYQALAPPERDRLAEEGAADDFIQDVDSLLDIMEYLS